MALDSGILKKLINDHIPELFPGAQSIEAKYTSKQKNFAVFSKGNSEIRTQPINDSAHFISRSQPFTKQELKIINDLISVASEYSELLESTQLYLNANSLTRTVARSLANDDSALEAFISLVIDTLEKWSAQTYEGNRIAISFGLDLDNDDKGEDFEKFKSQDCAKVLTNGYDTIIEFSRSGKLLAYKALDIAKNHIWTPFRYSSFCEYTKDDNKYAFILNRNGEILIFRAGEVVFAKRRGDWRLFTHKAVLKQMAFGSKQTVEKIREAIYESLLDVSFARCGGCFGSVQKTMKGKFIQDSIVKTSEYLETGDSSKASILRSAILNQPFHLIDRRLRQEILAIDGATIIDNNGMVIAAGAILNISQKETEDAGGGARLAAALCLRKYGMSAKISTDGEIKVFGKKKEFRFG